MVELLNRNYNERQFSSSDQVKCSFIDADLFSKDFDISNLRNFRDDYEDRHRKGVAPERERMKDYIFQQLDDKLGIIMQNDFFRN